MHMANAMGTKVLGLHAASNPASLRPLLRPPLVREQYDEAARKFLGKPASEMAWGSKIEKPGVMDLITVDDVIERFEAPRARATSALAERHVTARLASAAPPDQTAR